ncbi:hypothetical protein FJ656_32025, partial [Schumannella luteola]
MSDPTEVLPAVPPPHEPAPLRPRRARMRTRTRVMIIAGGAALMVLALVAGALVGQRIADDDRRAAQQELADAEAARAAATARVETAAQELEARVTATDAALAITGAGLDDAARPALQAARDAVAGTARTDGADAGMLPDDTELIAERATRLEDAVAVLDQAVADYLAAAAASGSALLGDRADAADDVKSALQAQLDALTASDPAEVAETLTAYRAAVDAVVASSDAARVPATPG